jgi:hypothetical protein
LQAMCTVFHRLLVEWLLHGQLNKHNENVSARGEHKAREDLSHPFPF